MGVAMTPQQRAVRQVLFPGKRGKLSADEYARFADLCARKGCPIDGKTDDETEMQEEQDEQRGAKRSRADKQQSAAAAAAADNDTPASLLGHPGSMSQANSEQEQQQEREDYNLNVHVPVTRSHDHGGSAVFYGSSRHQPQHADSMDLREPYREGSEMLAGLYGKKRGRPSKMDSAIEGLIKLNTSALPPAVATAAASARGSGQQRQQHHGEQQQRGLKRTRGGAAAAAAGVRQHLAAAVAAAAAGVGDAPEDYYDVYAKYLTCMDLYAKAVGALGPGAVSAPKAPEQLLGPDYAGATAESRSIPPIPAAAGVPASVAAAALAGRSLQQQQQQQQQRRQPAVAAEGETVAPAAASAEAPAPAPAPAAAAAAAEATDQQVKHEQQEQQQEQQQQQQQESAEREAGRLTAAPPTFASNLKALRNFSNVSYSCRQPQQQDGSARPAEDAAPAGCEDAGPQSGTPVASVRPAVAKQVHAAVEDGSSSHGAAAVSGREASGNEHMQAPDRAGRPAQTETVPRS